MLAAQTLSSGKWGGGSQAGPSGWPPFSLWVWRWEGGGWLSDQAEVPAGPGLSIPCLVWGLVSVSHLPGSL